MAAAIAIGLLGGCVNWPFDLGRVFSFFPFFAFGVLFAEPFRSWHKRWYAWGPLAAAIVVFYTVTVQRIVTAETPVYEGARNIQYDAYAVGGYLMQDRAVFYLMGRVRWPRLASGLMSPRMGVMASTVPKPSR